MKVSHFLNLKKKLNSNRIQPFLCTLVGPLNILLATRFLSYYDSSLFLLSKFVILKIISRYISSTSLNGLELRPFLNKYNDSKKERFLSIFYKVIASNIYISILISFIILILNNDQLSLPIYILLFFLTTLSYKSELILKSILSSGQNYVIWIFSSTIALLFYFLITFLFDFNDDLLALIIGLAGFNYIWVFTYILLEKNHIFIFQQLLRNPFKLFKLKFELKFNGKSLNRRTANSFWKGNLITSYSILIYKFIITTLINADIYASWQTILNIFEVPSSTYKSYASLKTYPQILKEIKERKENKKLKIIIRNLLNPILSISIITFIGIIAFIPVKDQISLILLNRKIDGLTNLVIFLMAAIPLLSTYNYYLCTAILSLNLNKSYIVNSFIYSFTAFISLIFLLLAKNNLLMLSTIVLVPEIIYFISSFSILLKYFFNKKNIKT